MENKNRQIIENTNDLMKSLVTVNTAKQSVLTKEDMKNDISNRYHTLKILPAGDRKFHLLEMEEDVVSFLHNNFHPKTIRNDTKKEIWIYKDGIYLPDGISILREVIRFLFGINYSKTLSDKIIDKIESDTYIEMDKMFNKFNPYLLPLKDYILDLKTLKKIDYNPKYIFFSKLNYNYNPDAICPEIEKHLNMVLDNNREFLTFQEALGNCLLRKYKYQKAVIMLGSGSNGKSKTLEIIRYLFTRKNCSEQSLLKLCDNKYASFELHSKMINISCELGEAVLKDTEVFKSLVGGDFISAERKHLTNVTFENYAKLFFACNQLPKSWDMSIGFKRRWLKFNFNKKFVHKEDYNPENPNHRLIDVDIMKKVTTDDEMEGFLNFIIQGYKRLEKNGRFTNDDIEDFWEINSDSVINFCNIHIETVDGERTQKQFIKTSDFKYKYNNFCNERKLKKFGDKQIMNILTRDYGAEKTQVMINGDRFYVWKNITWKEDY